MVRIWAIIGVLAAAGALTATRPALDNLRRSAADHIRSEGLEHLELRYAKIPCGTGAVWEGSFRWFGFPYEAWEEESDALPRQVALTSGLVCIDMRGRWQTFETARQCFDRQTRQWVQTPPATPCPAKAR